MTGKSSNGSPAFPTNSQASNECRAIISGEEHLTMKVRHVHRAGKRANFNTI
jgi:hypothetical protein